MECKGVKFMYRQAFNKVMKRMQDPVRDLLDAGVFGNRQRIKEMIPPDKLGSAQKVSDE